MPVDSTDAGPELSAGEADRIRTRVRLLVEITARAGRTRRGLQRAAARLSPEDAAVVADLERHGLDAIQLRGLLQGAPVLIWGRSGSTEKRPMYLDLSPDLGPRVPIPDAVSSQLTDVISELATGGDVTSVSGELAARFPPPHRANDLTELTFTGAAQGRGLFGSSDIWITKAGSDLTRDLLGRDQPRPTWSPPAPGMTGPGKIELGSGRGLEYAVRRSPAAE